MKMLLRRLLEVVRRKGPTPSTEYMHPNLNKPICLIFMTFCWLSTGIKVLAHCTVKKHVHTLLLTVHAVQMTLRVSCEYVTVYMDPVEGIPPSQGLWRTNTATQIKNSQHSTNKATQQICSNITK